MSEVKSETKSYALEEVAKHDREDDCWLIVHGKVYDVTKFLDEHPGGYDIIVQNTGKDATEDFEEIGHSTTAKAMLEEYYIGEYAGGDASVSKKAEAKGKQAAAKGDGPGFFGTLLRALFPILIILLAASFQFAFKFDKQKEATAEVCSAEPTAEVCSS